MKMKTRAHISVDLLLQKRSIFQHIGYFFYDFSSCGFFAFLNFKSNGMHSLSSVQMYRIEYTIFHSEICQFLIFLHLFEIMLFFDGNRSSFILLFFEISEHAKAVLFNVFFRRLE